MCINNKPLLSGDVCFSEMRGGCATGFNHVDPADYQPRLLLFRRVEDNVYVAEVGWLY